MDLDRYEDQAHVQCKMLRDDVLKLGIDRVVDRCHTLGKAVVEAYAKKNASVCHEYLISPPARRRTLLRNLPTEERREFLISALFEARCGLALLVALCRFGVTAGPSYAMILAQAAAAATLVHDEWPSLWPFEDYGDPFDEGIAG